MKCPCLSMHLMLIVQVNIRIFFYTARIDPMAEFRIGEAANIEIHLMLPAFIISKYL